MFKKKEELKEKSIMLLAKNIDLMETSKDNDQNWQQENLGDKEKINYLSVKDQLSLIF